MTTKKATSVKLEPELAEQVKQICKEKNCSQSDFIKNAVKQVIKEESFDETQTEYIFEENKSEPKIELIVRDVPEPTVEIID